MDEDGAVKPARVSIGEDLSLLSVDELEQRIADCEIEIERIKAELSAKKSSLAAAEAFFRK
jgi:uncharacterized small protein (DUF1192 family)